MNTKLKMSVIVAIFCLVAALCVVFVGRGTEDDQVALEFQRYSSDVDAYVEHVAFLWLTNKSGESYLLSMPGHTDTQLTDNSFGRFNQSWLVNCEFSDKTPGGWTNWILQPSFFSRSNSYLSLGPHSGILVRVPLKPNGAHRKVAVLCVQPNHTSPFWTTAIGFRVFRMMPPSLRTRVIHPKPTLVKVWCDRELSYPGDEPGRR